MNRRVISLFSFLFIILISFGCGGRPEEKGDVIVWHWMTDREEAFLELAKKYKEETGITVSFELYAPSDAYTQKVRASAQTNTLPDIYGLLAEKRDFAAFINAGHIADLTQYMEENDNEKETASHRRGVHLAADQLWEAKRITNTDG